MFGASKFFECFLALFLKSQTNIGFGIQTTSIGSVLCLKKCLQENTGLQAAKWLIDVCHNLNKAT